MASYVVAKRYAKAVLPLIEKEKAEKQTLDFILSLEFAFQPHAELFKLMVDPDIDLDQKEKILRSLFDKAGLPAGVVYVHLLLLQKHRAEIYPFFYQVLISMLREKLKLYPAEVITTGDTPKEVVDTLVQKMEQKKNKKFILHWKKDPSLLGGVIFRDGFLEYDYSLSTQLDMLRKKIMQEL